MLMKSSFKAHMYGCDLHGPSHSLLAKAHNTLHSWFHPITHGNTHLVTICLYAPFIPTSNTQLTHFLPDPPSFLSLHFTKPINLTTLHAHYIHHQLPIPFSYLELLPHYLSIHLIRGTLFLYLSRLSLSLMRLHPSRGSSKTQHLRRIRFGYHSPCPWISSEAWYVSIRFWRNRILIQRSHSDRSGNRDLKSFIHHTHLHSPGPHKPVIHTRALILMHAWVWCSLLERKMRGYSYKTRREQLEPGSHMHYQGATAAVLMWYIWWCSRSL